MFRCWRSRGVATGCLPRLPHVWRWDMQRVPPPPFSTREEGDLDSEARLAPGTLGGGARAQSPTRHSAASSPTPSAR